MRSLRHHRVRHDGSAFLVTRQTAVALGVGTTERYIRKVCTPVACDLASHASLYDLAELEARFPRRVA